MLSTSFVDLGISYKNNIASGLRMSFVCFWFQEKYGPKGQVKVSNGSSAKPSKDSKQQVDFDINVGLSERAPWFCRYVLCLFELRILICENV